MGVRIMKRRILYSIFLNIVCVAVLFSGCAKEPVATNPTESTGTLPTESVQPEVSVPEEFSFIKLGETTLPELCESRPDYHARRVLPDSVLFEYTNQDRGYVHILAHTENLVVYEIREVSESIDVTDPVKEYFTLEDFSDIVIGESTDWDVMAICQRYEFWAASFGAVQEIPMEGGGTIVIEYQAPDMSVRNIYVE